MTELHLIELAVLVPILGAFFVSRLRNPGVARRWSLVLSGVSLLATLGAWLEFTLLPGAEGRELEGLLARLTGAKVLVVDELNAPLLPLTALIYLLTAFVTLRTKLRRVSFPWFLISEAILLATLCSRESWALVLLLAAGVVPPYFELRARHKPTGVYVWHMSLFVLLLLGGWAVFLAADQQGPYAWLAVMPLLLAILIRCGVVPFHCWMTDLFEHAAFGMALLFVLPMPGAYAATRLLLPNAPDWVLHSIGLLALFTALYAAGMALVQREARRFFCYLFLSHSSLVLVGMDTIAPAGLAGALCVWLSIALGLTGFALTLRALEARHGRLSLEDYHGLYEHTPALAVCFLLTGLASVGFPGTFGFLGTELLVDGAVTSYAYAGIAVVVVAALNGIAVVRAYFLLFTGTRHVTTVPLGIGWREQVAVLTLAALIVGGGLYPQPAVASRHHAAVELLSARTDSLAPATAGAGQAHPGQLPRVSQTLPLDNQ